jgi:transposase-like protein
MTKKAKSRQEIAQEYGISTRTLSRWIQKNKLSIPTGLLSPKSQELIYQEFGKAKT